MEESCSGCYHLMAALRRGGTERCKLCLSVVTSNHSCDEWKERYIAPVKVVEKKRRKR